MRQGVDPATRPAFHQDNTSYSCNPEQVPQTMEPNTRGMFNQLNVFTQALLTLRLIYCTQMFRNYMYPNFGKTQSKYPYPCEVSLT